MIGKTRILKAKRLLTVNGFVETTMKKGFFDIKLMNGPRGRNNNAKNSVNSARFDNRRKGFIIVYAMLLRKTTTNPPCFVTSKRAE